MRVRGKLLIASGAVRVQYNVVSINETVNRMVRIACGVNKIASILYTFHTWSTFLPACIYTFSPSVKIYSEF